MHLWRHKNGIWYVLYGPHGKRRISTGARDRGEADSYLANFIRGTESPKVDGPTVAFILDTYQAGHGGEVRAGGALRYAVEALKRHLGDTRVDSLLPPDMKRYAKLRRAEGVAAGTILREVGVLRAAVSWVIDHRVMSEEDRPALPNPVRPPRSREVWITRAQAPGLIAGCIFPHLRLFVKMGLLTLARTGAILELPWTQVDFTRRRIDYGEGWGNKRRAIVPISDELLADLEAARRSATTPFVIEYAGRPIKTVKNGFERARERAGLAPEITPHILRHSGATWLVEDGVPDAEIARMMGDTEEMVRRVYGHHSPEFLKRASDSLQLENRR